MEAFRLVKKRWLFSDCSGEFAIHDYASSTVYQIQVKDESISIAKNGIATFLSALQIYWIKNQEGIVTVALTSSAEWYPLSPNLPIYFNEERVFESFKIKAYISVIKNSFIH